MMNNHHVPGWDDEIEILNEEDILPLGQLLELKNGNQLDVDFLDGEVTSVKAVNDVSATLNGRMNEGVMSVRTELDNGQVAPGKLNEDGFLAGVTPEGHDYLVIYDGISSAKGAEASAAAALAMEKKLQAGVNLKDSVDHAHEIIKKLTETHNAPRGTALAGILVKDGTAELLLAGDCQIDIQNESGDLIFSTIPQNLVGDKLKGGRIDQKEYWKDSNGRSIITQYLGMVDGKEKNFFHREVFELEPGMRITLRSDGDCDNKSSLQAVEINNESLNPEQAVSNQFNALEKSAAEIQKIPIKDDSLGVEEFMETEVEFKGDNVTVGVYDFEGKEAIQKQAVEAQQEVTKQAVERAAK